VTRPEFNTTDISNMPLERQDGCISVFAPTRPLQTYLCAWTFDAFECVRRTTSRGVPLEFQVPKESANVDHIPELKIVEFKESWCSSSLPPDRLQVTLVPRFHFSPMENCGLVIVLDSSLATPCRRCFELRPQQHQTANSLATHSVNKNARPSIHWQTRNARRSLSDLCLSLKRKKEFVQWVETDHSSGIATLDRVAHSPGLASSLQLTRT
jgi:hypothetical protein